MREFTFELPIGYTDEDGRLLREVTLRKMTGREEALLADRKLQRNTGKLVTELLKNCIVKIGEEPVTRKIVVNMTSVDRNYVLLELRKITFGEMLEAKYTCPSCRQMNHIVEDLEELPVTRLNGEPLNEVVVELEDGYEDRDDTVYTTMVFRLPDGNDEEKTASTTRGNASEGMNALLTRCLIGLGDMPEERRQALGTKIFTDLTMSDRARIERAFRQEMPGVNFMRTVECDNCGNSFQVSLDMSGFFSMPSAV